MMPNIQNLIDDAKCDHTVRALRWPDGVRRVQCRSAAVTKQGRDTVQPERRKDLCKDCGRWFDAPSETIFARHHQPLRTWMRCLYLMGLNLSNRQIGHEPDLHKDDFRRMPRQLREGIEAKPPPRLADAVEADEVYAVAGHKGPPAAVKKGSARVGAAA